MVRLLIREIQMINVDVLQYKPIPAGTHIAIIDTIAELGVQPGEFMGKILTPAKRIYIRFAFPELILENGLPMTLGKEMKAAISEGSELTKIMRAALSQELKNNDDIYNYGSLVHTILLKPVMISVINENDKGKVRAKLGDCIPLAKSVIVPQHNIKGFLYTLAEPNPDVFAQLPNFIQEKIQKRLN